jgi:hypothetical protein
MISIVGWKHAESGSNRATIPRSWARSTRKIVSGSDWKIHKARARVATGYCFIPFVRICSFAHASCDIDHWCLQNQCSSREGSVFKWNFQCWSGSRTFPSSKRRGERLSLRRSIKISNEIMIDFGTKVECEHARTSLDIPFEPEQ